MVALTSRSAATPLWSGHGPPTGSEGAASPSGPRRTAGRRSERLIRALTRSSEVIGEALQVRDGLAHERRHVHDRIAQPLVQPVELGLDRAIIAVGEDLEFRQDDALLLEG